MNSNTRNDIFAAGRICALLVGGLVLAACGGSSSSGDSGGGDPIAGIGGTGIVVGKVTNFGSIYVNGVKYNTDSSTFVVDDDSTKTQADLEIGMVVKLEVETENGELTTKATGVVYDDEVQGPVTGLAPLAKDATQRSFGVFGQTVTIDAAKTIFKGTSFESIAGDDVVEVSGFRVSSTEISATYVELKTQIPVGSEVELRGQVDQFLGGTTFKIGSTVINFVPGVTEIDVPGGLVNGVSVEVKGTFEADLSVSAVRIEEEDDDFGGEIDQVSLQGVISNYFSNSDFEIDGLPINAGSAQILPLGAQLGNGIEVEVEGDLSGGVLVADEVELREGESKVEALVKDGTVDTTTGSFQVYYDGRAGVITVKTDDQTLFKDEISSGALPKLSLGDLAGDDFVRVEGQEVAGELVASIVKRIDDPGPGNREFELRGAVDAFLFAQWIEILGIRFDTDNDIETEYKDIDGFSLSATEFFGQLSAKPNAGVGTLVEIKDDAPTYGVADEVEFED